MRCPWPSDEFFRESSIAKFSSSIKAEDQSISSDPLCATDMYHIICNDALTFTFFGPGRSHRFNFRQEIVFLECLARSLPWEFAFVSFTRFRNT